MENFNVLLRVLLEPDCGLPGDIGNSSEGGRGNSIGEDRPPLGVMHSNVSELQCSGGSAVQPLRGRRFRKLLRTLEPIVEDDEVWLFELGVSVATGLSGPFVVGLVPSQKPCGELGILLSHRESSLGNSLKVKSTLSRVRGLALALTLSCLGDVVVEGQPHGACAPTGTITEILFLAGCSERRACFGEHGDSIGVVCQGVVAMQLRKHVHGIQNCMQCVRVGGIGTRCPPFRGTSPGLIVDGFTSRRAPQTSLRTMHRRNC